MSVLKTPPVRSNTAYRAFEGLEVIGLAILTCKASSLTQTGTIAKFLDRSGQEKLTKTHR